MWPCWRTQWLGSLEVSRSELTSPWSTQWYNVDGPLSVNPVRSAWELAAGAELRGDRQIALTGRSWSGAAPIAWVDVSTDGGRRWTPARIHRRPGAPGHGAGDRRTRGHGWSQWSHVWRHPAPGSHELLARATDVRGRTQPAVAAFNPNGYFFDAVVRHPVTVV